MKRWQIILASVTLAASASTVFAQTTTTYSSYPSGSDGYYATPPTPSAPEPSPGDVSISVRMPDNMVVQTGRRHHHQRPSLEWVSQAEGDALPHDVVTGGYQPNPRATLFVCRAHYQGGMHPGKVFNGLCHFGWGGKEIYVGQYEVLVSNRSLRWVPASNGAVPARAIVGGSQQDGPLYVCQARYRSGMHPGKLYKDACLIGWGGQEVAIRQYNVLTR